MIAFIRQNIPKEQKPKIIARETIKRRDKGVSDSIKVIEIFLGALYFDEIINEAGKIKQ